MKKYRVILPCYFEFHVEAENEEDAKKKASNEEGKRLGWDFDLGWCEEKE